MNAPRQPARAEVVGSLLRPPRLLEARAAGDGGADEIVDAEIRAAVARQVDLGLDVVTDGEFARAALHPLLLRRDRGHRAQPGAGALPQRRRRQGALQRRAAHLRAPAQGRQPAHARTDRLRSITDRPFKVTLPAASWFLPAAFYEKGITDRFYDSHEELLEDTLAIQRELIAEAIGAGARYVQLDFPNYVQLIDEGAREHAIVRRGIDPDDFFEKALELDRRVIEGFPTDVTFGLHICRATSARCGSTRGRSSRCRAGLQRAALRRLPRRMGRARARGRLLGPAPPAAGRSPCSGRVEQAPPVETREQRARSSRRRTDSTAASARNAVRLGPETPRRTSGASSRPWRAPRTRCGVRPLTKP